MYINSGLATLLVVIVMGVLMTVYVMRRRVRLGRRKPTF
jgi:hypothetical protein